MLHGLYSSSASTCHLVPTPPHEGEGSPAGEGVPFPRSDSSYGKVQSEEGPAPICIQCQGSVNVTVIVQRTVVLSEGKKRRAELQKDRVLLWKWKLGNKLNSIN